ncbi:hypothetical protein RDWZM_003600 [Blomia tropicalis]|uniref:RRM domain-containing protein n=1 Tax=Blomia tropicalis TaxID=40697 RepID=A0A9Q0RSU2_BLOTA|nr:transformer 2 beta [Blomia tropicalis]KAJ6225055.1 hypothetical protein RDWZM_003600 [Blomia tropicalis]
MDHEWLMPLDNGLRNSRERHMLPPLPQRSESWEHISRQRRSRSRSPIEHHFENRSSSSRYPYNNSYSSSHEEYRRHDDEHRENLSHRSSRDYNFNPQFSNSSTRDNLRRQNAPTSRCLGVFGLKKHVDERLIRRVFEPYGPIESLSLIRNQITGESRGFAFVTFISPIDALRARDECNGYEIDGKEIRVDYSLTKRAHSPSPGIYLGKHPHRSRTNSRFDTHNSSRKDNLDKNDYHRNSNREQYSKSRDSHRNSHQHSNNRARSRSRSPMLRGSHDMRHF